MSNPPLFWVQRIEEALRWAERIPLWGTPPAFPWEKMTQALSILLQKPELVFSLHRIQVLAPRHHLLGFGTQPICWTLALTPLAEVCHWVIATEDVALFNQWILSTESSNRSFVHPSFQEGFYRYLGLYAMQTLSTLRPFEDLSLKFADPKPLPQESALCIDVMISLGNQSIYARVLCGTAFLEAFRAHFTARKPSLRSLFAEKNLPLTLQLEVGQTTVSQKDFQTLVVGDLLVLDRCSYDPLTHRGSATIALEGTPLFRARLKMGNVKLVDYAFYHEEASMIHSPEEGPSEEGAEDSHLWSTEQSNHAEDLDKLIPADEIPISLSVEVSRVKMNLDKLLALEPGNVIELPTKPEQGVRLVANGQTVALGELVKLGDLLGVKISQIHG